LRFADFCIWLAFTLSVLTVLFGVRLPAETYLLESSFYRCSSTFWRMELLLDIDGPITFDSRSKVSGVFLGYVVFSDSLNEECLSKYEIRSEPLLCGVCFSIFIGVLFLHGAFVL
jgi:hypothetical protein